MTAPDLAAFLLDRVGEDEEAAAAATPGPWQWDGESWEYHDGPSAPPGTPELQHGGPDLVSTVLPSGDSLVVSSVGYDADHVWVGRADAEHIARHDPARVLAECAAKRAIVDEHRPSRAIALVSVDRDLGPRSAGDDGTVRCRACSAMDEHGATRFAAPCPTLRLLAQPYASHADYRESWRP